MFVKTKQRDGRATFFLCMSESGGTGGRGWKDVEYSVCLGETLDLSGAQWLNILRASVEFRSVALEDVLSVLEKYVEERGLPSEILAGLREVAHGSKQRKTRRNAYSERRGPEGERTSALHLLGLLPGSSDHEIEKAFRKAARRYHPDVGGDPAKFRAIVDARDLLLGRATRMGEIA